MSPQKLCKKQLRKVNMRDENFKKKKKKETEKNILLLDEGSHLV